MEKLETNFAKIYGVLGDFDQLNGRVVGMDMTSALMGVSRSLEELQEELGLRDEETDGAPSAKRAKRMSARVSDIETFLKDSVSKSLDFLFPEVIKLQAFAKGEKPSVRDDAAAGSSEEMKSLGTRITDLHYDVGVLQHLVATIEAIQMEATTDDSGVRTFMMSDQNLHSIRDTRLFLAKAGEHGKKVGLYFDVYSVGMVSDLSDKTIDVKMKMLGDAVRSELSRSPYERAVLMSFGCDRPPPLGSASEISERTPELVLPKVKKYREWCNSDGVNGRSVMHLYDRAHVQIERHLKGIAESHRNDKLMAPLLDLAKEMFQSSKSFMQALNQQVDSFLSHITADHLGASESEAWYLVSEMLAAVFEEIHKARSMFGDDIINLVDERERCAQALTCTFRAHEKMEEIRQVSFEKHPCVLPALSLHLFGRKASVFTVEKISKDMGALVKELAALSSRVAVLEADRVGRKEIDNLKREHHAHMKDLHKK